MQRLIAAKPDIKCVFSAMGGFAWLYRLGSARGLLPNAPYAGVLVSVEQLWAGNLVVAADAYSKLLLMLNLRGRSAGTTCADSACTSGKQGVFKNRLSRSYSPGFGPRKNRSFRMCRFQRLRYRTRGGSSVKPI